mgnify:CR=1 FL=1
MNGKDAAPTPVYRPSAEITPAEYDYYMRRAQEMRAESAAKLLSAAFRAIGRLFARGERAPERRAPVLVKSRTA